MSAKRMQRTIVLNISEIYGGCSDVFLHKIFFFSLLILVYLRVCVFPPPHVLNSILHFVFKIANKSR